MTETTATAVVIGGGFAGVGCAKELGKHGVAVTLIDRNNYHQFQPLLYQVATAELAHRPTSPGRCAASSARTRPSTVRQLEVDRDRSGDPHR